MKLNKGILYILIGASFFGFTPIFAKLGFSYGYTLGQINIVQMMISSIILWSFTLIKRSSFKELNKKNVLQIMMTGCFIGLTSMFYYGSMQYLPASLAIILILVGVFFASNILNGDIQGLPFKGFIFGILSAFTYAGFIFFSGKVAVDVNPWTRSSLMVTGSTILVFILFMRDVPTVLPLEKDLLTTAVGVSLFGAVLPPLFFAVGAPLVSGGIANILTSIELPIAILSASLILSEAITPLQWLGTAIILVAIGLNELGTNLFPIRKHY